MRSKALEPKLQPFMARTLSDYFYRMLATVSSVS